MRQREGTPNTVLRFGPIWMSLRPLFTGITAGIPRWFRRFPATGARTGYRIRFSFSAWIRREASPRSAVSWAIRRRRRPGST